jgi:hypothetical protein
MTIISIISVGLGNEFITRTKPTKKKLYTLKVTLKGMYFQPITIRRAKNNSINKTPTSEHIVDCDTDKLILNLKIA